MPPPPKHPHTHAPSHDLPILALDIVLVNGRCTLAVVDACPVSANLSLPQHYMQLMAALQASGGRGPGDGGQAMGGGGRCLCVRGVGVGVGWDVRRFVCRIVAARAVAATYGRAEHRASASATAGALQQ